MFTLLKCIPFLFLLASCATKVVGLQQSEDFNYPNLQAGKLIIAGVTSSVDEISMRENLAFSNLMKTHITEERSDVPILPAGALLKKLGKKDYAALIEDYSLTGNVGEKNIALIKTKMRLARFVTFVKIESNEELTNHDEVPAEDSQGKEISGKTKITAMVERKINAAIQIVDLAKSNIAWSGSIEKSIKKYNYHTQNKESGLITLVKAVKGTKEESIEKKFPAPKAPTTKEVLAQIFSAFANNLPEQD